MSDHKKTIEILERLVEVCRDGQNGYRDAAEHVTDSNLRHFFNQQSLERAGFAAQLEEELLKLGEMDLDRSGSASGDVRRAWVDLKATLGGGDESLLASVESGDKSAVEAYEKATQEGELPEHLAAIVRRQYASVEAACEHVRMLRETRAA
jgi:uncharacterized protein (TIGR02284 family)